MAVKFSQFLAEALSSPSFLVGYNSTTNLNVRVSYADLVAAFTPGTGTVNYVAKWTGTSVLGNSQIFDNGTSVGIGTNLPSYKLDVAGSFRINYTSSTPSVFPVIINPTITSTANFQNFRVVQINPTWSNAFGNTNIYAFEAYKNQRFYDEFDTLRLTIDSNGVTASTSIRVGGLQLYNDNRLYYPAAGFRLNFSNSDKALLTSGGNFIIGTSPVDAGFRLDVQGTFRSTLDANINGLTVGKGGGNNANNTAVGFESLLNNTTGFNNTAIGYQALKPNTTGFLNTAIGYLALSSGTSASRNVAVGFGALAGLTNQERNVAVGNNAMSQATTGFSNTAIGDQAGNSLTTGNHNTFVGGASTGNGITTGQYNTIIGAAVSGLSSSLSNTIILADGQGNQRLYINSSGYAGIGTTSPISRLSNTNTQITDGNNGTSFSGIQWSLSDGGYASAISNTNASATAHGLLVKASGGSPLTVQAGDTTRFVVLQNGNTLIGTTTDAGYKLQVSGTTQTTALRISNGSVICDNTFISDAFVLGGTTSLFFYNNSVPQIRSNRSDITVYFTLPQLSTQSTFVINDGGSAPTGYKIQKWMTGSVEKAFLDKDGNFATLTSGLFGSIGTINASAVLEATSTTKGFLPPRMTNAQMVAIATPAAGLVVYDTTNNKLSVYDGSTWIAVH